MLGIPVLVWIVQFLPKNQRSPVSPKRNLGIVFEIQGVFNLVEGFEASLEDKSKELYQKAKLVHFKINQFSL